MNLETFQNDVHIVYNYAFLFEEETVEKKPKVNGELHSHNCCCVHGSQQNYCRKSRYLLRVAHGN